MTALYRIPCVHGERGPCAKCKRIEDRFAATIGEDYALAVTEARRAKTPKSGLVHEGANNG